ncbi:MAG: hypothetical protein R6V04_07855 [bacterium]
MNDTQKRFPYDVLHIGKQKCASTYIQYYGLKCHPEIKLIWREHINIFYRFIEYNFNYEIEDYFYELNEIMQDTQNKNNKITVFSNENFCGFAFTGNNARLIADLTYKTFGNIKCFIIVREPFSYIYSVWDQYVHEGGTLHLGDFLNKKYSPTWSPYFKQFSKSRLWFHALNMPLINYWKKLYGDDYFAVFLLEDLKSNPKKFFYSLYNFLGVDTNYTPPNKKANSSYSYPLTGIKRKLNRFYCTQHNPSGFLSFDRHFELRRKFDKINKNKKYKILLSKIINDAKKPDPRSFASKEIIDMIKSDNYELAKLLDRDVSSLGYEI